MIRTHVNLPIPTTWRWGIVRHVTEGFGPTYTPSYQGCQDRPSGTIKGPSEPVSPEWWSFIRKLNNDKGYAYARSIGVMWINSWYDQSNPNAIAHAENGIGGGAFVLLDQLTSTHGHIVCFDCNFDASDLDPLRVNWFTMPHLFFKAAAINVDTGQVINVGNGYDSYIPNLKGYDSGLKKTVEKWINLDEVELFPALPFTTSGGMKITEYATRGCSVFGMTPNGWTYLLKSTKPGERIFFQGWHLDTIGPVPPVI